MHAEKDVFCITKHSKQIPVEVICANLYKLLSSAHSVNTPGSVVTNCQSLIGKSMNHKRKNQDGEERWYKGEILSMVPGTTEWFNVKHDEEDNILTLNLYLDIEKGDLEIL